VIYDKTPKEIEMQNGYHLSDGQLLWRRWKIKELMSASVGLGLNGEQLFKQEYPLTVMEAFQSGGGNIFDSEKIDSIKPKKPLLFSTTIVQVLIDKGFKIWINPKEDGEYVIGCDPSDGEGADFSVIDIWDKNTLEQVGQYYGKLRPDELAEYVKLCAEVYNNAFVGVENNMLTTILFLSKIYNNYYYTTIVDERNDKRTKKIGWRTSTKTRDLMIDEFIIAFDEGDLKINSLVTISEMKTFVRNPDNGKREHAVNKHDDALFAGFIAVQMRKYAMAKAEIFITNDNKPTGVSSFMVENGTIPAVNIKDFVGEPE